MFFPTSPTIRVFWGVLLLLISTSSWADPNVDRRFSRERPPRSSESRGSRHAPDVPTHCYGCTIIQINPTESRRPRPRPPQRERLRYYGQPPEPSSGNGLRRD